MNIEQARALLGVDAETNSKAIRRAYLRAVKQHKPEQDPEGFQRVREAYELCARLAPYEHEAHPEPAPEATAAPPDPLPDYDDAWARHSALGAELERASPEERIARLRDVLTKDPDDLEIRYWLFDELIAAGQAAAATALARDGVSRGHQQFHAVIAQHAPHELTDAEIDALIESAPDMVFSELLRRERVDEAVDVAERAMQRFVASPHAYPYPLLYYVLALAAVGRVDRARALMGALRSTLDGAALGTQLDTGAAAQLLLVTDLLATWEALPGQLASILTGSMLGEGLQSAEGAVRAFARGAPQSAARAADSLLEHAPSLAAIVNAWMVPRQAAVAQPRFGGIPVGVLIAVMMGVMGLARVGASSCERDTPTPRAVDVQLVCASDRSVCSDAERLSGAIRDGDCRAGAGPAQVLRDRLQRDDEASTARLTDAAVRRLVERYERDCGSAP